MVVHKKYITRGSFSIIKISKSDAKYMREQGYGQYVKKSHSKHPTYYLVEEPDVTVYNKNARRRDIAKYGALSVYKMHRKEISNK